MDFIKILKFCSSKDTVRRIKRQARDWGKFFENCISDKGYVSKIHKELSKLNTKKINNPIKKRTKDWKKVNKSEKSNISKVHKGWQISTHAYTNLT